MLPAFLTSCLGMLRNLDPAGVWALWKGRGDEGRVNRIFPREDGDMSVGHIEVRSHQGKKETDQINVACVCMYALMHI